MKLNTTLIGLFLTIIISCHNQSEIKDKKYLIISDVAAIKIPLVWVVVNEEMIDFERMKILTDNQETLYIEVGYNCNSFLINSPKIIRDSSYYQMLKHEKNIEIRNYEYIGDSKLDDPNLYAKATFSLTDISGRAAKLFKPTSNKDGLFGVHFYKVANENVNGLLKINIYGKNLHSETKKSLIQIVQNIEWKNKCTNCSLISLTKH
jgi:hypothetical protein